MLPVSSLFLDDNQEKAAPAIIAMRFFMEALPSETGMDIPFAEAGTGEQC
jgi:hypothetical protein